MSTNNGGVNIPAAAAAKLHELECDSEEKALAEIKAWRAWDSARKEARQADNMLRAMLATLRAMNPKEPS